MTDRYDEELLKFIDKCPSCYHVIARQAEELENAGFVRLNENSRYSIVKGGMYYVTRGDSALIAFKIPEFGFTSFRISASHSDSPRPVIKENPEINRGPYTSLNIEMYGSALLYPWFDRPLSIAGRLCVRKDGNIESILVDIDRDLLIIPSLAIHMDREVNNGKKINVQSDMLPLFGLSETRGLLKILADAAGINEESILAYDLFAYNRQKGIIWGAENEFMSAPSLDDIQCAWSSMTALIESRDFSSLAVHAVFDNEEIGSCTAQGAASTFLSDTLFRICDALGYSRAEFLQMIPASFMLSADNAHALHPNSPEKADPVNKPVPGKGVVLKYSGNKKYTTDGFSAAKVHLLANTAGVQLQVFTNRADLPGGSTLGNISSAQLPVPTADIGIAQLAMHSPFETCGTGDTAQLVKLMKANFESL